MLALLYLLCLTARPALVSTMDLQRNLHPCNFDPRCFCSSGGEQTRGRAHLHTLTRIQHIVLCAHKVLCPLHFTLVLATFYLHTLREGKAKFSYFAWKVVDLVEWK